MDFDGELCLFGVDGFLKMFYQYLLHRLVPISTAESQFYDVLPRTTPVANDINS